VNRNLIYTAIVIPYTVSFVKEDKEALDIIEYVSTVLWGIDIIINFFCAYEDKHDNLVVSRKVSI